MTWMCILTQLFKLIFVKFLSFFLTMVECGYSKAQLKREIAQLSHGLYNIDFQIQLIRQGD